MSHTANRDPSRLGSRAGDRGVHGRGTFSDLFPIAAARSGPEAGRRKGRSKAGRYVPEEQDS